MLTTLSVQQTHHIDVPALHIALVLVYLTLLRMVCIRLDLECSERESKQVLVIWCECAAGCAILSMDNYNDGSRVIDSNFDGTLLLLFEWPCMPCRKVHFKHVYIFSESFCVLQSYNLTGNCYAVDKAHCCIFNKL